MAIKSFKNKALEKLFETGVAKGINAKHAPKLLRILDRLNVVTTPEDMNLPGYGLHKLEPKTAGRWAVSVNGPWRITFEFDGENAVVVDYEQYH